MKKKDCLQFYSYCKTKQYKEAFDIFYKEDIMTQLALLKVSLLGKSFGLKTISREDKKCFVLYNRIWVNSFLKTIYKEHPSLFKHLLTLIKGDNIEDIREKQNKTQYIFWGKEVKRIRGYVISTKNI